jgi:hypothetical protein
MRSSVTVDHRNKSIGASDEKIKSTDEMTIIIFQMVSFFNRKGFFMKKLYNGIHDFAILVVCMYQKESVCGSVKSISPANHS